MSKLSVKHLVEIIRSNKKCANVFVTFMESERRKNNCYLVFGDKNVFLFFSFFLNFKY